MSIYLIMIKIFFLFVLASNASAKCRCAGKGSLLVCYGVFGPSDIGRMNCKDTVVNLRMANKPSVPVVASDFSKYGALKTIYIRPTRFCTLILNLCSKFDIPLCNCPEDNLSSERTEDNTTDSYETNDDVGNTSESPENLDSDETTSTEQTTSDSEDDDGTSDVALGLGISGAALIGGVLTFILIRFRQQICHCLRDTCKWPYSSSQGHSIHLQSLFTPHPGVPPPPPPRQAPTDGVYRPSIHNPPRNGPPAAKRAAIPIGNNGHLGVTVPVKSKAYGGPSSSHDKSTIPKVRFATDATSHRGNIPVSVAGAQGGRSSVRLKNQKYGIVAHRPWR